MTEAVGVARLVLAAVFAVAGWTKLSDPDATREAVRAFGVPRALARPAAVVLPVAELATAVLLVFRGSAVMGAIAAAVLLGLFIIGISVNMARGNRVDCNCFGQLHSAPIGVATLVRNLALGALAAFIIVEGTGGTNVWDSLADLSATGWLAVGAAVVVVACVALIARPLLRPIGRRLRRAWRFRQMRRRAGLPVGADAPRFELPSTSGEHVSLDGLLADGKPVLLVFTAADCTTCETLMPEVAAWQDEYRDDFVLGVLGSGSEEDNRANASTHGIRRMALQQSNEVASSYAHFGTPNAVVVSPDGKVASRLAVGADAIRDLASQLASTRAGGASPPRGRRRAVSA